jgi:hypothetical protein
MSPDFTGLRPGASTADRTFLLQVSIAAEGQRLKAHLLLRPFGMAEEAAEKVETADPSRPEGRSG